MRDIEMKGLTRNALVTLLIAYALSGIISAASSLWEQQGTFGLTTGYGAAIRAVMPGSPAAVAGIVAGDKIRLAAAPFEERRYIAGVNAAIPVGKIIHFTVIHEGLSQNVVLRAVPYESTSADRSSLLFECIASLIFIAVGATLILLRPSAATWGFGLYCLLVLPTADYPFRFSSASVAFAAIATYDIVQNIGVVGLIVFALEFPRRFDGVWRERLRRAVPLLFAVLAAMTLYPDVANLLLGTGAKVENQLLQIVFGATFLLAICIVSDTYRRIAPDERERLRWVLVGFIVGLALSYVGATIVYSSLLPIVPPQWLVYVLVSLNVLLPLTVAHAVVRHRVLDIDFVIGRTLVYATLTGTLAALFGLLDWLFGHILEDFRFSVLVEAGISIGVAFAFDALHERTGRFIEAVFFRKRRIADMRLTRLAEDLPQAQSVRAVEAALVSEVIEALGLTSAALFRRTEAGSYARSASLGWREADRASLDDGDLLVLALRSRRRMDLADFSWRPTGIPTGALAPVTAIRLYARSELAGIVLYGGHSGGSDVDPAEIVQLERLTYAAGVALDALEAERLRAENAAASETIVELRARLDELRRIQTPGETAQRNPG